MKNCNICKEDLGLFAKKFSCLDGYICDDCFRKSKILLNRKEVTVEEVRKKIFNKKSSHEREQRQMARERNQLNSKLSTSFYPTVEAEQYLKIDTRLQKFKMKSSLLTFDFIQLISYEFLEQEYAEIDSVSHSGKNNGVVRAVAGDIIAGSTGAIVGAATANTTTSTKTIVDKMISKMQIQIVVAPNADVYNLVLLDHTVKKYSKEYNLAFETSQKIIGMLKTIEDTNAKQSPEKLKNEFPVVSDSKSISIPEQIKQYKELLDIGAITQQEYDDKKRQLLAKE